MKRVKINLLSPIVHLFVVAFVMLGVEGSARATIIRPVSVVSQEYEYKSADNLINNSWNKNYTPSVNTGSSLADALKVVHAYDTRIKESFVTAAVGGESADLFDSLGSDTDVDIVLDLTGGGDVTFQGILLWQYQNNGGTADTHTNEGNAARTVEVRVNTETEGSDLDSFSGAPVTLQMKPIADADSDDSNDLGGVNSVQAFDLGSQSGRYVLLSLTDNYYGLQGMTVGGSRVGLGEVRFSTESPVAVPEPAALALVLCSGMGFIGLRRWFG